MGSFVFRCTDDREGLTAEESSHVDEIAAMLFLQDDLRIKSASYAMLPALDFEKPEASLSELEHVQSILAYYYSAPHPTFGDTFLSFEHASVAVFSPEPVSTFLLRPEHHVEAVSEFVLTPDKWHRVPGYQGRYNFLEPFWVTKGSRLYPPIPHLPLNISQDLAGDIGQKFAHSQQHYLLLGLLRQTAAPISKRVLTALGWYNRANSRGAGHDVAIMQLAVAFEALLALPRETKTDRFVDAVSLILGRIPRLKRWAEQFYDARSDVAHEGRTELLRFKPAGAKTRDEAVYQPLITYGRQIFQLCVGALLFGASLAESVSLQEKFETNQERLDLICKTLADESRSPAERFTAIDETVAVAKEYQFVAETGLNLDTVVGAAQLAAKTLILCPDLLDPILKSKIEELANAKRSRDWYEVLSAIQAVHDVKAGNPGGASSPQAITLRLIDIVWWYTFRHYFWHTRERRNSLTE